MDAKRKEKLGQKFVCFSCGTRFYDLHKPTPLCPKCGADQRQSPALKSPPPSGKGKAKRPAAAAPPPPPPPPPPAAVKEAKKPRFAEAEEEIGVAVDEDAEDIAGDLEEELAEDLDGEGFTVTDGEPEEEAEEED